MQFSQQLNTLAMEVDVALQLLIYAVYLDIIDKGGDFALLQSLGKERERLLQKLYIAVVDNLLQALQLLVVGAQGSLSLVLCLHNLQLGTLTALPGSLDIVAVAIQWEAYTNEKAVDAFAMLGIATIAKGDIGQPLVLLQL